MRGHVDAETLAEYREDLLSRRPARRVAAHLRECAQCARLDAQLAGVSAALARAPTPPMPDALTARITAALAAEASARSARDAEASPQPTPVTLREPEHAPARRTGTAQPRWRGFGLRAATAAAVAVVVVGGGYGVLTLLSAGGGSESGGSNGAASTGSGHPGPAQPGFSQQHPGAFAVNGLLPSVIHSGTDYQPGKLGAQVGTVLARSAPSATGQSQAASTEPANPFGAFQHLPACVHTVTGGSAPKLVDIARYRGQPAAVIVAAVPTARELKVWVVGTRCSGKTGDVLARTMVTTVP